MLFRSTVTALAIVACWILTVGFSSAQDSSPLKPPKPPNIHFGQIHVAKLRAQAEEPTVTLVGHSTKTEVRTREVAVTRMVPQERTRSVVKDGKKVEKTYIVQVPVTNLVTQEYRVRVPGGIKITHVPAKEMQVWNITGKRVETADWLKQLVKPRHVFVLDQPVRGERSPIDALYRSVLKDDVLFVYVPQFTAPNAPAIDAPARDNVPRARGEPPAAR